MTRVEIASCSEAGTRSANEDRLAHGQARRGWYAVLADGAGGHERGADAACITIACVERLLRDDAVAYSPANLTQTIRLAHAELQHQQSAASVIGRMHCTVVVLWIDAEAHFALWTHVGDSRLYRIRHGRTDIVTADDSVVHRLLQAGIITSEQMVNHPQKNHLLSALGGESGVDPHTVVRPVEVMEGDAFLLCSDGWWEHFDEAAIAATLVAALTPRQWLDMMRERIIAARRPRQDNYSAIAVWVGDPGEVTNPRLDDTLPRPRSV